MKRAKGSRLTEIMRLKRTTQNEALVEVPRQEHPKIQRDHDVSVCPIPDTYVELQDLQFNAMWHDVEIATSGYAEVRLQSSDLGYTSSV
jgi:hypothetical protein